MKIRTDFVTNSSSSSFTVINFTSSIIDEWLQKHPVVYPDNSDDSDEGDGYTSLEDLLDALANNIDFEGEIEFLEDKGIIDNIVYLLGEEEYEDEGTDSSLFKFIKFLKKHKKAIEADGTGEILYASQFEADAPTIESFAHQNGKTRHIYLDLNELELDDDDYEEILNLEECSPEMIRDVLKQYASCNGIRFAITGKLNTFENRDELVEFIESKGGTVGSGVTSKTDYLINNDSTSTSSKNKKANELGVSVITEAQFLEMFGDPKDSRSSDAEKTEDRKQYGVTEEIAEIRLYSNNDPDLGTTITAEMALVNNESPIYLLEYCYAEVPYVEFLATTESVWAFYTNMDENPKDSKKLQQILKKAEVEHIEEMCEEIIRYEGFYKKQLILLHNAVLKEAEKLNTDVGFEWEFN